MPQGRSDSLKLPGSNKNQIAFAGKPLYPLGMENFENTIPFEAIVAGFAVLFIAGNFLRRKLRQRHLLNQGQIPSDNTKTISIEERISANSEWSGGKIKSKNGLLVFGLWLLSVVWCLTFGVAFIKNISNPQFSTAQLSVLGVFAFLGAVPIFFAIKVTLRQLRFGSSYCLIDRKAGVLGHVMSGLIRNDREIKVTGNYSIKIECIECYHTGTGKNRTSHIRTHWQAVQQVASAGKSSRAGIPFSFELPESPPETGCQLGQGPISWQLKIEAPADGVNYSALFVVPVFRMT